MSSESQPDPREWEWKLRNAVLDGIGRTMLNQVEEKDIHDRLNPAVTQLIAACYRHAAAVAKK